MEFEWSEDNSRNFLRVLRATRENSRKILREEISSKKSALVRKEELRKFHSMVAHPGCSCISRISRWSGSGSSRAPGCCLFVRGVFVLQAVRQRMAPRRDESSGIFRKVRTGAQKKTPGNFPSGSPSRLVILLRSMLVMSEMSDRSSARVNLPQ